MGATEPLETRVKLFVYGTLRRGEAAHHLLEGASFLELARTEPRFSLLAMPGGYPALLDGGSTSVVGEVYRIEPRLLEHLDPYEDVPELYRREQLEIAGHVCWAYLLQPSHAAGLPLIPSGDWKHGR